MIWTVVTVLNAEKVRLYVVHMGRDVVAKYGDLFLNRPPNQAELEK